MVWNRIRFPNMALTYMRPNPSQRIRENQVIFKCDAKYTKSEIKEYLTKIYSLPVEKVNTMNYLGKTKRAFLGRYVYKEPKYKKAIVTLKK